MAVRTRTPSRTPSAWPRNWRAARSTSALKRSYRTVIRPVPPPLTRTNMRFVSGGSVWLWGRMPSCARVGNPRHLRRLAIGAQITKLPHMLKLAAFFVVLVSALAAPQDPVQWKLTFDSQSAPPGSKILGHLTAKLDPGWHLYSLTTPPGPVPTTATLAENPAVAGFKVYQPKPVIKMDPSFNANTETFGEEVTFLYEIELKKDAPSGPVELTAQVRYQCCNDNNCLRPKRKTAVASINIDPAAKAEAITIPAGYREFRKTSASSPPSAPVTPVQNPQSSSIGFFL